jgi:hypothetical protein
MVDQATKPAVLDDEELTKLRALESKLGDSVVLVAYDKPLQPADLSPQQLDQLKKIEQEMGRVFLVAWKKPSVLCK